MQRLEQLLQSQPAAVMAAGETPAAEAGEKAVDGNNLTLQQPLSPAEAAGQSATETYLKAFTDYASGRFPEAIAGFRNFIGSYPDNVFAGNAQYWLGECYYSQRLLSRAAEEFNQVLNRYPDGVKAPEALLKLIAIYGDLNQPEMQTQLRQQLLERYPLSRASMQLKKQ